MVLVVEVEVEVEVWLEMVLVTWNSKHHDDEIQHSSKSSSS